MKNVTQMPGAAKTPVFATQEIQINETHEIAKIMEPFRAWAETADDEIAALEAEDKEFHRKLKRKADKLQAVRDDYWKKIYLAVRKDGLIPDTVKENEVQLELNDSRTKLRVSPRDPSEDGMPDFLKMLMGAMPKGMAKHGDAMAKVLSGDFGQANGEDDGGPTIH